MSAVELTAEFALKDVKSGRYILAGLAMVIAALVTYRIAQRSPSETPVSPQFQDAEASQRSNLATNAGAPGMQAQPVRGATAIATNLPLPTLASPLGNSPAPVAESEPDSNLTEASPDPNLQSYTSQRSPPPTPVPPPPAELFRTNTPEPKPGQGRPVAGP